MREICIDLHTVLAVIFQMNVCQLVTPLIFFVQLPESEIFRIFGAVFTGRTPSGLVKIRGKAVPGPLKIAGERSRAPHSR